MFLHVYRAMLKCLLRNKQLMFWSMAFPLILGTFFQMALSDLASHEAFRRIPVAVVEGPGLEADGIFRQVLAAVSQDDSEALFSVTYTDREEAERLLREEKVTGIVDYTPGLSMTVAQSGINQTILKSFLDDYLQTSETARAVIAQDPAKALTLMDDLTRRETFIRDVPVSPNVKDPYVSFFYALIAMACLYGGFLSMEEVGKASADMSAQGMRVSLAPTNKMKVILSSMAAAVTIQLMEIAVLMAYLSVILEVDFGGQIPLIAVACVAGTVCGSSFGAMIGCVVKGGEGVKVGVLIGASMAMSALAGLMSISMRFTIAEKVPFLGFINPANLINDSFYCLYFGPNMARYGSDILNLFALTAVFSLIAYCKLRRQKYASV